MDWFKIGRGVHEGCILAPCFFNIYAEYIIQNAGQNAEAQAGIKIAGININNLRYADDTTLRAESKEELESLLIKVKEESKKAGLKLVIPKTKIMDPIQLDWIQLLHGKQMGKQWKERDFIVLSSKITADGDCSHEIRRYLLLGWKTMTNLDRILKSRDITLPTKVHIVKAMVFPVVMYGCESWTIKKAEHWTVVLEKTLESALYCQEIKPVNPKGDQPWIFIGRTDAEAETPLLWPPGAKSHLTGKDLDAGKNWRQEERGMTEDEMVGWRYWLNGHDLEQIPRDDKGQESLVCCSPWGCKESDTAEWTTKANFICDFYKCCYIRILWGETID